MQHYHFPNTSSLSCWVCVLLALFLNLFTCTNVCFVHCVYSYTSTALSKLLKVSNMFCIWKNKSLSPQPCASHSVNLFFRNFLVILIFFQPFPGLSSVISNYCWTVHGTRLKCSVWFWETWHFNSIVFCHLGIWYLFLGIEFCSSSAE